MFLFWIRTSTTVIWPRQMTFFRLLCLLVFLLQIISKSFFLVGRNIWDWCSGGVNRLQQCDICWCCWSETLHTGQSAQARHYAWNVTAWILSISSCFVSIWLIFCRCVLNVKKLEFLYIWQTAMVRHMYIQVISFLIFFSCYLCFKYDDTFVTLHLHTANTDQWFLSS